MPLPENIIILFYWTAPWGSFLFALFRGRSVPIKKRDARRVAAHKTGL